MFTTKKKTRVYKNCQPNYGYIGPTLFMLTQDGQTREIRDPESG